MIDLSLVPVDFLITEIEKRCSAFIMAYHLPDIYSQKGISCFIYGKGKWGEACFLSNVLNNDVLNNWNGELKMLQRINEDGIDW